MQIYTVQTNDTIDTISGRFGVNPLDLAWMNQIEYPFRLAVGQALLILSQEELAESQGEMLSDHGEMMPSRGGTMTGGGMTPSGAGAAPENGTASSERKGRRSAWFNGYAYPWINQEILEETSHFLTSISIFSYGFTEEGELVPPQAAGEQRILEEAELQDVIPVLVLTPLDASGHFNNNLVTVLVRDLAVQQKVIRGLWEQVQEKGYGVVDVDFEYVLAEDRDLLVDFVRRLRTVMNLFGVMVTVALAPKTSRGQRGLLYEGIDYKALGEAADGVLLMTYEWGYTYGPPMAVAPINMVRRVVEYGVSEIPPVKISLGIPNYGYDWPLPYEQGVTKARSLGYTEAIQLAIDHGVPIYFDEIAKSPHFRYWQYGVQHEVWFEDVRSMQAKFDLMKEFGLAGAGYWQLMRLFRANWLLAEQEFHILKK